MNVIYTDQSIDSLEQSLNFYINELGFPPENAAILREQLLNQADSLALNPNRGQLEELLEHLNEGHRRIVEGHHKIIYKVVGKNIYITDFFDSRQHPHKMKG